MKKIITILYLLIGLITFAQEPLLSFNQRYLVDNEEIDTGNDTIVYTLNHERTILSMSWLGKDVVEFKVLKRETVRGAIKYYVENVAGDSLIFSLLHDVDGIYGMTIIMLDPDNRLIEIQSTIDYY